ncbi:MAG: aldehyde dehydrogenase family protein [Firmicutes bacterium]|nr:aldehyde dehydrogenase family protein [Bacillota bacterium]
MDVSQIYSSARNAQQEWMGRSVAERLKLMKRLRTLIANQSVELAQKLHDVTGKPSFEALTAEILTVVDTIRYWEKRAVRLLRPQRMSTPLLLFGRRSWVEYSPRGVVLVISPWNYPFQLSMIPTLAALLTGNAVVLKPSEVTSELDSVLADLFVRAGFPSGLVQVISGDGSVGAALVQGSPDMIFFTGSVATGKAIQKVAAEKLIPTILELGGKDAMIVCGDAPLQRAISGAVWGGFTNCGQVCLSTERILIHEEIYVDFLERFVQQVSSLAWGRLISPHQVQVVRKQVEDALSKGARLVAGVSPDEWSLGSLSIPPTVLTDVTDDMIIMQEETFGPVVTLIPFTTEEEAIRIANSVQYGLGASVWSGDLARARKIASQLQVGNISINDTMITVANPHLPFGGVKSSGLGSYHGSGGLRAFCAPTAVMASSGRRFTELNWFPYNQSKQDLVVGLLETLYGNQGSWLTLVRKALNPAAWLSGFKKE